MNPPSHRRVQRRFCGTFGAGDFLYPPLELVGLSAIAREWHAAPARVVDAVALDWNFGRTVGEIAAWRPDVVVAMMGFATFRDDCGFLASLSEACPQAFIGTMGYLASRHAEELMDRAPVDFVLLDEPERSFSELLGALENGGEPSGIASLVWRSEQGIRNNGPRDPDRALDELPFSSPDGIELSPYRELLQPRPMWSVLTSRGCPFPCTFCVTTYGKTTRYRSAAHVASEVELLASRHGIRAIRILDDTFTLHRERVLEICDRVRRIPSHPTWTALTRLDTVDEELLRAMRAAGCRRLDIGVESASPRILEALRKGIDPEKVPGTVALIRSLGIETLGFFIVGALGETPEELDASIELAVRSRFDYVVVTRLQTWIGTPYASSPAALPPGSPFEQPMVSVSAADSERHFYRSFYLRPGHVLPRTLRLLASPLDSLAAGVRVLRYLSQSGEHDHL